jgi:phosphoenolpyruvate-protein kinase (PTS system EI component)
VTTASATVACSPGEVVARGWRPRVGSGGAEPEVTSTDVEVRAAFEAAAARLDDLARSLGRDGATSSADIVAAEALIARDPAFVEEVVGLLAGPDGIPAGDAVTRVAERHASVMEGLASADLRERAADIRQVGRMVGDELAGRVPPIPPPGPFVLLAHEVTAPDLLTYAGQVAGAVSVLGGAGSHASIVARALGVPLVAGVEPAVIDAADGAPVLVDGAAGDVVVSPDDSTTTAVRARTSESSADELRAARALPAVTTDGVEVTLLANVASTTEARRALDAGAEGVGLLRTELPFLAATDWPSEREHREALRPVLEVLRGRPVVVRLLDFTSDKTPPFLAGHQVASSLTLLLQHEDALDAQLRAVLRDTASTDVRVMLPMVTRPEELVLVRDRLARAADAVGTDRLPAVGAMLELPEAIERLAELADVADFFSLGTNDLTASTLGLGRTDPRLSPAAAADPRVLRLVERAVLVCLSAGRALSVCGDAAADPLAFPLLLGAGVRTFSVAPSRLDALRSLVREHSTASGRDLVSAAVGPDA